MNPPNHRNKTKPTLHTIKPLEWEKGYAKAIDGDYAVFYSVRAEMFYMRTPYGKMLKVTSIEDGKAQAEAHYREQLGKCLEVYNG